MNKTLVVFFLVVGICVPVHAFAQGTYIVDTAKSFVKFSFRSTLHPVEGMVKGFKGSLVMTDEAPVSVTAGEVIFDVGSMDTQEPKRDENMMAMFHAQEYPSIVFTVDPSAGREETEDKVYIKGRLKIRSMEQPIAVQADIVKTDDGYILRGRVPLSLKSFALKPPSVLLLVRVFDRVNVDFDLHLTKSGS